MNAMNNELMVENGGWRALESAELCGIEGGSPIVLLSAALVALLPDSSYPQEVLSFNYATVSFAYVSQRP
jgi:hypothetical protein